jgi:LytS/YehU family sensor histidine kinase
VELSFIRDYFFLHKIRDDGKIQMEINVNEIEKYEILPVSLQVLVENAIKHNKATRESPLRISIFIENRYIIVRNNLQRMALQLPSTQIGLKNLAQRISLTFGKALVVEETADEFIVKIPLICQHVKKLPLPKHEGAVKLILQPQLISVKRFIILMYELTGELYPFVNYQSVK